MNRFWAKVNKDGPVPSHRPELGPCWVWTAYCDPQGYSRFYVNKQNRSGYAYRWAWEQENGPVPDGLELDHLCFNRACVRPSHLEAVTTQVNAKRRAAHIEDCPLGHVYSEENTYVHDGHRYCRLCNAAAKRRQRAAA